MKPKTWVSTRENLEGRGEGGGWRLRALKYFLSQMRDVPNKKCLGDILPILRGFGGKLLP